MQQHGSKKLLIILGINIQVLYVYRICKILFVQEKFCYKFLIFENLYVIFFSAKICVIFIITDPEILPWCPGYMTFVQANQILECHQIDIGQTRIFFKKILKLSSFLQ